METFTIHTTDDYVPFVNVGMYGSLLSPEEMFSNDYYELEEEGREELEFDFDRYRDDIEREAASFIKDEFFPESSMQRFGVVSFKTEGISSPRCYNYTTDRLCMAFEVTGEFLELMRKMVKDLQENPVSDFDSQEKSRVQGYINRYWQSHPGYWCFLPSSLKEMENKLQEFKTTEELVNDERMAGACLCLAAIIANPHMLDKKHYINRDLYDSFCCQCFENLYYYDYATVSEPKGDEEAA